MVSTELTWLFDIGAPCLSFDVLRDGDGDGDGRERFPLSMLLCAGTQADTAMSNRYRTKEGGNKTAFFFAFH